MKVYILFLLSGLLVSDALASEPLRFIVNYPGSAPYLYFDKESDKYKGVIPDILQPLIEQNKLKIRYIANSRKRSEEYMYDGVADMIMLSEQWLSQPDQLIASIPLLEHKSFLYKSRPFSANFSLSESSRRDRLCARQGYIYPNLQVHIDSKRLIRVDSSNHLSMLRMLFKDRCELVVMNEYNAANLMNSSFFTDEKLYSSEEPITVVPLNIILRKPLVKEKQILDAHIRQLREQGDIERFIDKHMGR